MVVLSFVKLHCILKDFVHKRKVVLFFCLAV